MIKPFPLVCSESLKLASCYDGQFSGMSDASVKIRVGLSITIPGAKHPEGVACGLSHAAEAGHRSLHALPSRGRCSCYTNLPNTVPLFCENALDRCLLLRMSSHLPQLFLLKILGKNFDGGNVTPNRECDTFIFRCILRHGDAFIKFRCEYSSASQNECPAVGHLGLHLLSPTYLPTRKQVLNSEYVSVPEEREWRESQLGRCI